MIESDTIGAKRTKALDDTDQLPAELRSLVHEYGLAIVRVCLKHGITRPNVIHELVREIWTGARQTSQPRAPSSTLDWYFTQVGADINTATLLRLLSNQNLIIVPRSPTVRMIEASMTTIANFDQKVTKQQKHKLRLEAALLAGSKHLLRLAATKHRWAETATPLKTAE